MSCGCNSSPCNCQPRPSVCCTPTTESVEYTFENANLVGIGFFDNETDNLVQFRGAYSDNASLVITLDAANNALKFSFDPEALITDIPDATTTQRGIGETATNAEAQAKAAADKFLTPSNLAALGGSTTFAGLLELATDAETIAGVSTTLAVTPAGLAAVGATNTTTTFTDGATRAGATPAFDGQIGVQLDTNSPWVGNGTGAGDFDIQLAATDSNFQLCNAAAIEWSVANFWTLDGDGGNGSIVYRFFDSITFEDISSGVYFATTALVNFGGIVDFDSTSRIYDANVVVPANSVLTTSGTAGQLSSALISGFLSSANTQTGYTNFANGATLRTCDTATVTLQQLAQIVGTLINDLKAVKLPQT